MSDRSRWWILACSALIAGALCGAALVGAVLADRDGDAATSTADEATEAGGDSQPPSGDGDDRADTTPTAGETATTAPDDGADGEEDRDGGDRSVRERWLYAIGAALAAGLTVVLLSYAPAGPNFVASSRPTGQGRQRSMVTTVLGWAGEGGWQVVLGLALTALGTYYIFEFDRSNQGATGVWSGAVAFGGLLLILTGVAVNATADTGREESRELQRVRQAHRRASRASVRATSAALEARRLLGLLADADRGDGPDEPLREEIGRARQRAARARRRAAEAAELEREAAARVAELSQLLQRSVEAATGAEADRDEAIEAMARVERTVQDSRRALMTEPTEYDGQEGGGT